ncbi:MAG: hypothetical protein QOJ75_1150, partial [Chloroflexota bacterium]|nr:hypothetical protein [Chloroflexota bacterium]
CYGAALLRTAHNRTEGLLRSGALSAPARVTSSRVVRSVAESVALA